jgi:hypothetical protein
MDADSVKRACFVRIRISDSPVPYCLVFCLRKQ